MMSSNNGDAPRRTWHCAEPDAAVCALRDPIPTPAPSQLIEQELLLSEPLSESPS
jgi:hypothetical protein